LLINFAILRRWQNNPRAACQLAEEALQLAEGINAASEQHLAQTVLRAAEVDLGEDPKEALADVQRSVDALREISSLAELVPMLALLADIALIGDDEPTAYQALHDALHIADRGVGRQALLAEAVNNARFNALVKRAHIKDFVEARDRLADAELHTTSITDTSDATPPPTYSLRVYALGKDQVERDGALVPDSAYESTRSRELFMHLLFLGPQTWEDVGLYFWKDKSAKQVRNNFQTNVHRTRTALGRNAVIHENGFYMVDPTLDIWCDVFEMEKLIRQARLLSSHTAYTEGLWQSVVDLYQGDFLPSVDSDWADLRRHELREKYFEALIELGGCLLLRDALTDAIGTFQKVLLVDPLREEAHREIMRCYGQRGEVGSVLKQYRQLEDLLAEELGAIPSEETTALMKKLTSHKNLDT
jgi:two-component SAPR family response regulator